MILCSYKMLHNNHFYILKVSVCACVGGGGGDRLPVSITIRQSCLSVFCCTLHSSLFTHLWGESARNRAAQERKTRICAQVNATPRTEGGVFPCASINGRTGDSSSSSRTAVAPHHRPNSFNKKKRGEKNMTHDCNKRGSVGQQA